MKTHHHHCHHEESHSTIEVSESMVVTADVSDPRRFARALIIFWAAGFLVVACLALALRVLNSSLPEMVPEGAARTEHLVSED